MRWMILVDWVSRSEREGGGRWGDVVVVGWVDGGDERICRGESLLKM